MRHAPFICLITCLITSHSRAQSESPTNLGKLEETAFQNAVTIASQSVVQIETFGGMERVGEELVAEGPTTGTIVGEDGWILSSLYSFRQQPASILVTMPNGDRLAARIVARDNSREIVLLKVESESKLPLPVFAPKADCTVGQWTIALGKTYDKLSVSQSLGIISALDRAYGKAIQTDAKVSPINYGGPLVDLQGRVIGILSPISPGTFLEGDSSQLYDSGIGFAIPSDDILARLPKLQKGENIDSGKLGVVTSDQNELIGPVRITGTAPGSPAAKSKLQADDVIVEAGGQPISLLAHLKHALGPVDAGQSIAITVLRDGQRLQFEPVLTDEIPTYRRRYLGLRLEPNPQGLEITGIEPKSPAAAVAGLAVGQTLTHCNGFLLETKQDLLGRIAVLELDEPVRLQILPAAAADAEDLPPAAKTPEPLTVELSVATWPEDLPTALPRIDERIDDSMQCEIVDVVLGDFPNKAFAVIPPLSDARELGLLIVYPEPGELDREKTLAYWSEFSRNYGWIVAVINSGDPRSWSREEVELAGRVLGRLDKNYEIDESRTVIAGLGVGGRIALGAAVNKLDRVRGVAVIGTDIGRLVWRKQNAPLQSLDFLMVGDVQKLAEKAQQISELGYSVNVVAASGLAFDKWESLPAEQIHLWLEGLGRL